MNILIIGGKGFVAHYLGAALEDTSHQLTFWDSKEPHDSGNFVDVTDLATFKRNVDFDVVINLAAEHRDDVIPPSRYYQVNVIGTKNVCDWCEQEGIRKLIFTSSVAVYGFASPNADETAEHAYFNEYGRTKSLAEDVCKKWVSADLASRSLVIIRPTVIFGPGNRGNVFNLLRQVASKKFAMFGDGENVKSMAYVENVAAFIKFCLEAKGGEHIYNYIDKPDLTMNELVAHSRGVLFDKYTVGLKLPRLLGVFIGKLADCLSAVMGKKLPVSSLRVTKFMATTQFSSRAADSGFVAPFSLFEGLDQTLRYEFIEDNTGRPTFQTE